MRELPVQIQGVVAAVVVVGAIGGGDVDWAVVLALGLLNDNQQGG